MKWLVECESLDGWINELYEVEGYNRAVAVNHAIALWDWAAKFQVVRVERLNEE